MCCVWMDDQNSVKQQIDDWLRTKDVIFMKGTLEGIKEGKYDVKHAHYMKGLGVKYGKHHSNEF